MSGHADTIRRVTSWCGHDRECAVDPPCDVHVLVAELVRQADRIAWLEGDVAGWRIKSEQLHDALAAMVEWFEKNDGRVDDFGELWIVKDARAALDGTPSEDA